MFNPNTRGMWLKKAAKRTITGKETFMPPVPLPLSIVSLKDVSAQSSVRADSSASRGAAQSHEAEAKFLVPPAFKVARGDVVRFSETTIEIVSIEPRRDVFGKLDHYEVTGDRRADQ